MNKLLYALTVVGAIMTTAALAVDNSSLPVCNSGTCGGTALETFANKDVAGVKFPKQIPYNSSGTELFTSGNPAQVTGANGSFPATQSGTWTVQPGNTANTTPWLFSPSTGGNTAAVKAASTAPVATDPALVVAISPNSVNANGQTTMANSAPVVLPSDQTGPCTSKIAVNQTASTDLVTLTNKAYICSIVLVSASAQNISLVEGTGTVCATSIAAIIGGTTASVAVAANGGFSAISGIPWLKTATTANHLCLLQSGAGNVSGVITYMDHS